MTFFTVQKSNAAIRTTIIKVMMVFRNAPRKMYLIKTGQKVGCSTDYVKRAVPLKTQVKIQAVG